MLQLKLAAQSLADMHREHEQQQQQLNGVAGPAEHPSGAGKDGAGWQLQLQLPQCQQSRVQQLYLQIVHELAVLPRLEEEPGCELGSCVPVMLRLPRLMARVVLTEQQHHQEHQVGVAVCN